MEKIISRCPCCQYEMEKGYLENRRMPIVWYPAEKEPPFIRFYRKADRERNQHNIGEWDFLTGATAEAYYCPACKIVLLHAKD